MLPTKAYLRGQSVLAFSLLASGYFMKTMFSFRHKLAFGAALGAMTLAHPAIAQETESDEVIIIEETEESTDESRQQKVVVTGSRLQRSEFTSVAPVQVITADFSREIGLVDPADVLQDSTAASGLQIDDSFQGFVLDNGPGSSTISFRGLGSGRTLALINGRRIAPIGVEGAPSDPSVNLIPSSFVDSYELLLDGASSVYGSDAVAGVANVILRNDYDGFEVGGSLDFTEHGGGEFANIYGSWGKQFDKGFFAVALDYEKQERMKLADREWSSQCARLAEVTESGEVRQNDLSTDYDYPGMGVSPCEYFPLGSRIQISGLAPGSVYYTPGSTNVGIPNYSESALYGIMVDGNGDGLADFSFYDYTSNGTPEDRDADIIGQSESFAAMVIGDYDVGILGNATAYYEGMFVTQDYESKSPPGQIFEYTPATDPFNPCNPNGVRGVDCGAGYSNFLLTDPVYRQNFTNYYTPIYGTPFNLYPEMFGLAPGPTGPLSVRAITSIRGDRDNVASTLSQTRAVGGLRGDLEFIDFGTMTNWTYDVSLTYSKSQGESLRSGIRDDKLQAAITTQMIDPGTGNIVCGIDANNDGVADGVLADGSACVPIDFYADSVLSSPIGDFATQAERDYLFGDRTFDTTYEQTMFQAYASGDLFPISMGGTAAGVIGFEYRQDELHSDPNIVASDGLLWGYFKDRGAEGKLETTELFGEIELPILLDKPGFTELNLNLSGRYTDTEFAGTAQTWSAKLGWRPINSLLFRGTFGTSFRAPNVREQFLQGQSGFATLSDPCLVPDAAFNPLNGTYDPTQDGRDQTTLDNCVAAGVDPTTLGGGNLSSYSVEVFQIGANVEPLEPETSESYSYGFVFEQPFTDFFDATLGVTYYKIEVEDAIASRGPSSIIADCYINQPNYTSGFCGNITRGADGLIDEVDYDFYNVASEVSSGYDINFLIEKDFVIGDRELDAALDLRANKLDEVSFLEPGAPIEQYVGEFGFPEWTLQATARFNYDDFRFTWRADWQGEVEQDPDFIDPFGSFTTGQGAYTCLGPALGDENCREIGYADAYVTHDASIAYLGESWTLVAGVRNVFDEDPPFVSPNEVFTVNGANAPLGYGYDLLGRTFFVNLAKEF
ncbi:MAG: outer membrane cobalamin receptor protein [Ponticaulis sp.]|nr:outer membrane cobalamin receptor protein [Ponticaulis sp.]